MIRMTSWDYDQIKALNDMSKDQTITLHKEKMNLPLSIDEVDALLGEGRGKQVIDYCESVPDLYHYVLEINGVYYIKPNDMKDAFFHSGRYGGGL